MYYYDENDKRIHDSEGVALNGAAIIRHLNNMLFALERCSIAYDALSSIFAPVEKEIVIPEDVITNEGEDQDAGD